MFNKPIYDAVTNVAKLFEKTRKMGILHPEDVATLQYNVFILQQMPYYTGIDPKRKEEDDC